MRTYIAMAVILFSTFSFAATMGRQAWALMNGVRLNQGSGGHVGGKLKGQK